MRACTAAGINNSLLPRDCSCGEFACSAVWGRALFLVFVGFPVVLSGEETFPLAFLAFVTFGTGEGLLWYGICTRCTKTPSCGTRCIFRGPGAKNRLLVYRVEIRC